MDHTGHDHTAAPAMGIVRQTIPAVVQIVALKRGMFGNASSAWTGSGTIVHPSGIILTNCHVANPHAMGMPAPKADALGISIMGRSDEPPALTYLAEIVVQSPELDLAVLRIVSEANGKKVGRLNLPYLPIGDSDNLELGDRLSIFGFPGIGGDTITYTTGSVSGFTASDRLKIRRAWVKTDATIAGGNSGGTGVNSDGQLVGIPTQAAAGDNITPVDARPVADTNRDGRVDQRDSVVAIGGFINGLRPVNLAKPLLKKAGLDVHAQESVPMQEGGPALKPPIAEAKGRMFGAMAFSTQISRDNKPINPSDILPTGTKNLHVVFPFRGMENGVKWAQVWSHNNKIVLQREDSWSFGEEGYQRLTLSNQSGLPDGEYHLVLSVEGAIMAEGKVAVGRATVDTDTQIAGSVVDARNNRPIPNALVIALKPNVRASDFIRVQNKTMAFTSARTDNNGQFLFPAQLPKGQAYSLVVVARGYKDLIVEGGLRISASAPEQAQIPAIPLQGE